MQILARSVKFNNSEGEFERSRTVNIYKNNPQIKKNKKKKQKKKKTTIFHSLFRLTFSKLK